MKNGEDCVCNKIGGYAGETASACSNTACSGTNKYVNKAGTACAANCGTDLISIN